MLETDYRPGDKARVLPDHGLDHICSRLSCWLTPLTSVVPTPSHRIFAWWNMNASWCRANKWRALVFFSSVKRSVMFPLPEEMAIHSFTSH